MNEDEKFDIAKKIAEIVGIENVKINESMRNHTSFKIGGNADYFVTVNSKEKLINLLELNKQLELPITIVGNGSNLLVSDNGIRGLVLKYTAENIEIVNKSENDIHRRQKIEENQTNIKNSVEYEDNDENNTKIEVLVETGLLNGKLAQALLKEELTGFEFASGIPGTIGGAIYMNAGAFGTEIGEIIKEVTYIDLNDEKIYTINQEECKFQYRESIFKNINAIILSAKIVLAKGNKEFIKSKMEDFKKKRMTTQPYDKPNAGSTFKRGNDFTTAKLIDEAGLKGYKIGGAEISMKHAGFIINANNASAKDVIELIKYTQEKIMKKYNKKIEAEVRIIGE